MTIEEAAQKAKELEQLNLAIWSAGSKERTALREKFRKTWLDVQNAGFKILRWKELDINRGYKVPRFKVRADGSEDAVAIVDNRPNGSTETRDCTTRCISFCTGINYNDIKKEQLANAAAARAKGYYGNWRCEPIWSKSLLSRGFYKLVMPRKVSRKVFLKKFKDSGIDEGIIATKSSGHIAAIDMKSKKILDTWNSAGGRIQAIYVPVSQKTTWMAKLNAILG